MDILELLKGKKMKVMTDMRVEVELTIKNVEEERGSRDLEESNSSNDWWPKQETWVNYIVYFTTGACKKYTSISDIKIIE
jgi:hypothetical protein